METNQGQTSYFEERIYNELVITPEINIIRLKGPNNESYETPIFSEDSKGNICIAVYTLDRKAVEYDNPKATPEKSNIYNERPLTFFIKRLKEPQAGIDGKIRKYNFPKGAGTYPFIPPSIIEKFEKKEKIKTLVLTEGYFKAFKGAMHGVDIIGLSSITHYKDKNTQQMYFDVLRIIKECNVENIIILYDGDCIYYSKEALEIGDDLYKRPIGFFNSAKNIRELLKDYNVDIYFAHVNRDIFPENPKGLDDLLVLCKGIEEEILQEIKTFGKPGKYFYKENITHSLSKLQRYLRINSAQDFYNYHADTIQERDFIFNGTKYQNDQERNELVIVRKKEAKDYFRVGDNYYEYVSIPNKYGHLERHFIPRKKATIVEDHGKKLLLQIEKYKAFYVQPEHINFQLVSHSCYNLYSPFEHLPEEGSCPTILKFIRHIFGKQYRLGMDYMQLLYQKPTQALPILCLVSEENNTGKTTYAKLLKEIFTGNMVVVGNADLANDFNSHYASKLIICCDETFIDKQTVIERVKSLSTCDRITMNAKGKDQIEIDFFGKFILLSNNEENFIYANRHDSRYWVIKVPVPKFDNVSLLSEMIEEIPFFLNYLNKRKMKVPKSQSRMWFNSNSLITDAFRKIIENSRPSLEKEIHEKIRNLFFEFGDKELLLTAAVICERYLNKKSNESYVSHILKNQFKVTYYKNDKGKEVTHRFKVPNWNKTYNHEGKEIIQREEACYIGRPFVFYRNKFLTPDEEANFTTFKSENDEPDF